MSLTLLPILFQTKRLFFNLHVLFAFSSICYLPLAAQIPLTNIGFETGTFTNWQGATGSCCPVYVPNQGIVAGRHSITSGNLFDSLSNNLIQQVCAGSAHSAQLGNSGGDAESEQLYFEMIIPADSLILAVKYAALLQNAPHPPSKQPRFQYAISSSGIPLSGCTEKLILAGDTSIPFIHFQDIDILPWQTIAIDLSGKSGDTLKLTFETGDCEPGGHFGYAYIDVMIIAKKINLNGCHTDGSLSATVASGLDGMWMNGSLSDSILVANPGNTNDIYYLLNNNSECEFMINANHQILLPSSEFSFTELCEQRVEFIANNSINTTLAWDFGDGNNSADSNVTYKYNNAGIYEVELTATGTNNCVSTALKQIEVEESPEASFSASDTCAGAPLTLKNESQNAEKYYWYVDGNLNDTTENPNNLILSEGIHSLHLIAENNIGCLDTTTVSLNIKPKHECLLPESYLFIPNAFSPNGDGINDFFEITNLDKDQSFEIYNRFGQFIYNGNSWNGTHNSKICESGVYIVRFQQDGRRYFNTTSLIK